MLRRHQSEERGQIEMLSNLVPGNHILRDIDAAMDFVFIYELVEDKYCLDNGRPSIDPVVLVKILLIKYLFGSRTGLHRVQV